MEAPRVNILIANYNYGQWVVDAIESAFNQTYPNISVTIIDSGSTDDSWMQIYTHVFKSRPHNKHLPSEYDIRTCTVSQNNKDIPVVGIRLDKRVNAAQARNIGIEFTKDISDYYMILDSDDVLYKDKVLKCMNEAVSMKDMIGIVYADYDTCNVETGFIRTEYKRDFDIKLLQQDCIIHSGSLVLTKSLEFVKDQFGYYDSRLTVAEDYDLWLRITKKFLAVHVREPLTLVRVHPQNSTSQVDTDTRKQCFNLIAHKHLV